MSCNPYIYLYLQLKVYASTQKGHLAHLKYKGHSCVNDVTVATLLISAAV